MIGVIVSDDIEYVKKYIPEMEGEIYAHSWLHRLGDKQFFVCILNFKANRKVTHGTIAHEATHLAHMILEQRGSIADYINDEHVAYLVEYITDFIYKSIGKKYKVNINE